MAESSLASCGLRFGFLRRAPSSGKAEVEATWAGASVASRGHLGHLQLTLLAPSVDLLACATDLPPLPVASSIRCHTPSLRQGCSLGVDFGAPTVKQAASGRWPAPLPGGGSWEGGRGKILDWGGAAFVDLGVRRCVFRTLSAASSTDNPPSSILTGADTMQFSKHFAHTISLDPPSNSYLR